MSDANGLTEAGDLAAIRHLEQSIKYGKHWYLALLEAIGLWSSAEDTEGGRTYRFLIGGEAFDWLLLAERLCGAVDGLLPADEKTALLFHGKPPLKVSLEQFKNLIGPNKYRQSLNYFYGVVVEEALILAVKEEVRKEGRALGLTDDRGTTNEAHRRIYGATRAVLFNRFRREKGYPQTPSVTLAVLKEFTYWLFKYRVEHCDKTKVASDTKKGLEQLSALGFPRL